MAHNEFQKKFDVDKVFTLKTVNNAIISSTTTVTGTPWILMDRAHHIAFICQPIDANLAGAITASVLQATSVSGSGSKTIGTAASTSWSAGTGDLGIKVLEVEASQLDVANGFDCVSLKVVTAGGDSFCAHAVRGPLRHAPASLIT